MRVAREGTLLASASVSGEYANGSADREVLSAAARFYQRRGSSTLEAFEMVMPRAFSGW